MKTTTTILLLLLATVAAPAMSFWNALSQIESGDNDKAIGSAGELGRYQVKPAFWTPQERLQAQNQQIALTVAIRHMNALKASFKRLTGRDATDTDAIVLWKAGVAGYARKGFDTGRMSAAQQDRIERLRNLMERK